MFYFSWFIGNWTKCSSNCQAGIQFRTVYCQQVVAGSMQSVINDSVCVNAIGPTPSSTQECNKEAVCPQFHIGDWGPVISQKIIASAEPTNLIGYHFLWQCDKLCGDGTRHRKITCFRKVDDRIEKLEDSDCEGEVPSRTESCTKRPCEGVDWITSPWSGVSYTTQLLLSLLYPFCLWQIGLAEIMTRPLKLYTVQE